MRRGELTSFPAPRAGQVLAHVELRCGGRNVCPYCRAEYEARHAERRIFEQLSASVRHEVES